MINSGILTHTSLENGVITEDGLLDELLVRPEGYLNKLLFVE